MSARRSEDGGGSPSTPSWLARVRFDAATDDDDDDTRPDLINDAWLPASETHQTNNNNIIMQRPLSRQRGSQLYPLCKKEVSITIL